MSAVFTAFGRFLTAGNIAVRKDEIPWIYCHWNNSYHGRTRFCDPPDPPLNDYEIPLVGQEAELWLEVRFPDNYQHCVSLEAPNFVPFGATEKYLMGRVTSVVEKSINTPYCPDKSGIGTLILMNVCPNKQGVLLLNQGKLLFLRSLRILPKDGQEKVRTHPIHADSYLVGCRPDGIDWGDFRMRWRREGQH